MLAANPLVQTFDEYRTGLTTSLLLDVNPMLLCSRADRASDLSSPVSYHTAADESDILDITEKIRHVSPFPILLLTDRQVREAIPTLTYAATELSC